MYEPHDMSQPAIPEPSVESSNGSPVAWGLLILVAALVPFYDLGAFRTLGSHEAYAVVPAKEMLASGDWIVPRYGDLPRLRKPPLGYWLVAASGWLFGSVNEFSARVPAAVASLALAALMGLWATRWYGRQAGYWAAIVQLTSVWVVDFSRKAEVDMVLCLLSTAAMFLIAGEIGKGGTQRNASFRVRRLFSLRWTAIYALLSCAWLAKFHYAAAMVFLPVAVFWIVERRWRDFFQWFNPIGLLLLAAFAGVWPWLVVQRMPGAWDVWREETLGRAVGSLDEHPVWFYLPHLIGLTLPWTFHALAMIPRSWRAAWKQGDSRERFLWIWLIVQNGLLAAQANKHKHYLMAALPIFSLLAARGLVRVAERARRGEPLLRPLGTVVGIVAIVVGSATAAVLLARKWPYLTEPVIVACTLAGVGGAATLRLLSRRQVRAAGWMSCGFALACFIVVTGWIVPTRDHRRPDSEFAQATRDHLSSPDQPVCVYGLGMSPVLFYVDEPAFRAETRSQVERKLTGRDPLAILTREPFVAELRKLGTTRIVRRFSPVRNAASPREPPLVQLELKPSEARVASRSASRE